MQSKKISITFIFLICSITNFTQNSLHKFDYIDTISSNERRLIELNKLFATSKENTIEQLELYLKIGDSFYKNFKYDSAIISFNEGILLSTKLNYNEEMANLFRLKGVCNYYLFNRDNALTAFYEGLLWAKQTNQVKNKYTLNSGIGAIYVEKAEIDKNKKYGDSAKKYLEESLNEIQKADSLTSQQGLLTSRIYATFLLLRKEYATAEKIFANVLEKCRASKNNEKAFVGALSWYAVLLSEQGKKQQALRLVDEAIAYDSTNKLVKNMVMFKSIKGIIYKNSKQFDSAYHYMYEAYIIQEKNYTNQAKEDIANAEAKYRNELLQRNLKIEADKKTKLFLVVSLISIALVLSWLVFYFYQKKKTALQKKKQAELSLHAFIDGEEKERTRLSRDLHDGIVQELLSLKFAMKAHHIDEAIIDKLEKANDEIRNISHQLMPYTLKELGLAAAIDDACQKLCNHSNIAYSFNNALTTERLAAKIEISLYRIFQELLNNIIKHSKATQVNVQLVERNGFVNLIVEDNGIGFTSSTNHTNGIGLENIKSRVNLINGKVNFESTENDGTIAIVRIPV
jgi:signal transduction histidine kinase